MYSLGKKEIFWDNRRALRITLYSVILDAKRIGQSSCSVCPRVFQGPRYEFDLVTTSTAFIAFKLLVSCDELSNLE